MSIPEIKPRKIGMSEEIIKMVTDFFQSEIISRQLPGKFDFVTVREGGVKVKKQKHLILFTLREAYTQFKESNPNIKIGFSKFSNLRPKNVLLPGKSGTHQVCVCKYHQVTF